MSDEGVSITSRLKRIEERYRSLFKGLLVLAGIVFLKGLEVNPQAFLYILPAGFLLIIAVALLRRRGRRALLQLITTFAGRAVNQVSDLGADFSIGAGFGILLAAGLDNWGGWVAFGLFFVLALEMISLSNWMTKLAQEAQRPEEAPASEKEGLLKISSRGSTPSLVLGESSHCGSGQPLSSHPQFSPSL